MSNYKIGAYEALQWAWNVLLEHEKDPDALSEARRIIRDELVLIGNGKNPEFREKINL
jgi:hypothetical protein